MGFDGRRVRMAGGAAGVLFVIIALVAFLLPGAPPKANEAAKVGSYFVSKRGDILASNFLLGVAFTFFLVFVGSLRVHLGAASINGVRPGAAILAGGAVATALVLAATAVANGLAFRAAGAGDANLNVALYDVSNDLLFLSGFGFAAFFVGASAAGSTTRALPRGLVATAPVVGLVQIVAGVGLFAKSGFFATGGALTYISVLLALIWVLAASALLIRLGSAAPADGAAVPTAGAAV